MRKILFFCFILISINQVNGQYITEIDYDNVSTDNAEFVEMFFPTGTNPMDFSLILYSGNNGMKYDSISGFTCTSITGGNLCVWDPTGNNVIQNGPDGIVLWNHNTNTLVQGYAYEGDFSPTDGAANGVDLVLLGANDSNSNNVSLQDNDGNGVFILAIPNSGVLPIKLKAPMTVTQFGKDVIAAWTTASELNNSHFDIEHSRDNIDYTVVGTVKGSNETDFDKSYSFVHKDAPAGVNYYRLTQYDFDGKSETFDATNIEVTSGNDFLIYPTLTTDFINVSGNIDGVSIFDGTGRFILFTKEAKQIDVSNFNKGLYLLKSGNRVAKFAKM